MVGTVNFLVYQLLRSVPFRAVDRGAGMKSYHNTNLESGAELQKSETRARTEEELIVKLYLCVPSHVQMSARKLHSVLQARGIFRLSKPLTNTRRALSNLTKKGYLQKNDQEFMVKEGGKRVHTWSLCNREQLKLL